MSTERAHESNQGHQAKLGGAGGTPLAEGESPTSSSTSELIGAPSEPTGRFSRTFE